MVCLKTAIVGLARIIVWRLLGVTGHLLPLANDMCGACRGAKRSTHERKDNHETNESFHARDYTKSC